MTENLRLFPSLKGKSAVAIGGAGGIGGAAVRARLDDRGIGDDHEPGRGPDRGVRG
ncbi:hypothetical protein [Rhodococcus chondri]|uniref:Short-chain dehydrogenase n=1 Tax=Rhodococcus chondri TaxID=3065941 RepID=A0ABU7JNE0_9NOCA|nr:hypothetical protein [Rhodococcus sp. CC-R104]MEE2030974.1 hypothetical protein [Rhodococcus sp. CC-R104]